MTRTEFQTLRGQHIRVSDEIRQLLEDNKMSLIAESNGSIWLCDDGNDVGYTGDCVQGES